MIGKEQPNISMGLESAVDELSLLKEAAHNVCKDGEDNPTTEAPNHANLSKLEGGTLLWIITEQGTYISGLKLILVWLLLALIMFLMLLDISIVIIVNSLIASLLYSTAYSLII